MREWRFVLAENRATLIAFLIFIAMFWIYVAENAMTVVAGYRISLAVYAHGDAHVLPGLLELGL